MANPTWFDVDTYMANKLAQIQAIEPKGAWTEEKLKKAFEDNGYKGDEGVFQHFNDFGMDENVSPNAQFDAVFYLRAKADQLNTIMQDGKSDWSVVNVLDAINAAGMNVWEHYVNFGSQEGIAASAGFDSTKYVIEKTKLMNETKEGGRANWTVAEVQAAFAENGLSALEHYNLFGQAEFKAAGKEIGNIAATEPTTQANGFHLYSGAQEYTLEGALAAHANGSLSAKYMLTNTASSDVDAGNVTVAQQATLKAFIAAAENGADYAKSTVTYDLQDTVANIDAASGTVKANAGTVNIMDTLANVVAGDDALVNGVDAATGTVAFGAKAESEDGKTAADVVTTTVKYDDLDGKIDAGTGSITLAKADGDKAAGDAIVSVDATGVKDLVSVDMGTFFANADLLNASHITLKYIASNNEAVTGTDGADIIVAGKGGNEITGGAGADQITLGDGIDTVVVGAVATAGIDTVTGFGNGVDILSFTASTAKVAAKSAGDFSNLETFKTLDDVLATFAAGETNASELGANMAVSFAYNGAVYVVIGDGSNAGYAAADDAVIKLAGVTLTDTGIDLNGAAANS